MIALAILAIAAVSWWWSGSGNEGVQRDRGSGRAVPVLVVNAEPRSFDDEIEALGSTRAAESVNVTSRVSNVITAIRFQEGQSVDAGDVLVELENSEATANYAAAQSALIESRSQHRRARELLRTQAVSQSQVEELEARMLADEAALAAAGARLQDHLVTAPFAGVVGLRRVSLGTLVTPGTIITTLDDVSTVLLDFEIPETYLSAVAVGQSLRAQSAAYPRRPFSGIVETVDSRVDPVTRAVTVRARLSNDERLLLPGMFMTVRVLRETTDLMLIPEQALVPVQDQQYLYIVVDGVVEARAVEIGRRVPGLVEIVSGISMGDVVIVEGTQRVRDGSAVQPRPWERAR